MKRIITALTLLCASICSVAQNNGRLYWSEREIRLSDYATITEADGNNGVFSAITWDLSYTKSRAGNLIVSYPSYRAFFDQKKSKAIPSSLTPTFLEYQQLVFDVAELYGRKLSKASTNNMVGGVDLSKLHMANMNKDLSEYANITFNGTDSERVKQCRKKVAGQIAAEPENIPIPPIGEISVGVNWHVGYSALALLEYQFAADALSGPHSGADLGFDILFGKHSLGINVTGTSGSISAPGYYMDRDWTAGNQFDMTLSTIQYAYTVFDTDYWEIAPCLGFGQIGYYHTDPTLPRAEASVYNTGLTANAGAKARFKAMRFYTTNTGAYDDIAVYGKIYGSATKIHGGIPIFLGIHLALGIDFSLSVRQ